MAIGKFLCDRGHYVSSTHRRLGTCPMCAARDFAIANVAAAVRLREFDKKAKELKL
jgi:hypothetical protein